MRRLLLCLAATLVLSMQAASKTHQALNMWAGPKAQYLIQNQSESQQIKPEWMTQGAWLDYQEGLEASGNRTKLLADGMEILTQFNGPTTVQFDMQTHRWQVEIPILTTYQNAEWVQKHTMLVKLQVERKAQIPLKPSEQFAISHIDIALDKPVSINTYKAQYCQPKQAD